MPQSGVLRALPRDADTIANGQSARSKNQPLTYPKSASIDRKSRQNPPKKSFGGSKLDANRPHAYLIEISTHNNH